MKIFSALKSTFKLAALSATILATTSLTNCGGGGAGGEDEATVRPKTLDGLSLSIGPGVANLSFVRAVTSRYVNKSGQTENGAVVYSPGSRIRGYEALTFPVDAIWPLFLNNDLSYTYTAINDSSGLISLTGGDGIINSGDLTSNNPNSPINIVYFNGGSETYNINITFGTDGNTITSTLSRIAPDDVLTATLVNDLFLDISASLSIADVTVNDPSILTITADGAPVPVNYTTENVNNDQVSGISNESLDLRTLSLLSDAVVVPGILETGAYTFTKDATSTGGIEYDEIGTANYEQPLITGGAGVPNQTQFSDSGTYSYKRILGTDKADVKFVGSQIGTETITLDFIGKEGPFQRASGTYSINGGMFDGETGTFRILNEVATP